MESFIRPNATIANPTSENKEERTVKNSCCPRC